MSEELIPVTVQILDREYRVTCPLGEEDDLQASAELLDQRMQEVKDSGKVVGTDRIAVMVALNVVHELLQNRPVNSEDIGTINNRIKALCDKVDTVLESASPIS
jgi:cell division protein ZapA